MSKPNGRPRSLTPEQEREVYQRIQATKLGRRCFVFGDLARDLKVGVSTLQRIVMQCRQAHLAEIAHRFHEEPQNSKSGISP